MASGPITSWQIEGEKVEAVTDFLFFPKDCSCQAPLSMGFYRQEYWSTHYPPPGDLPAPGIKAKSLTSPALAGGYFTTSATWKTP